MNKIHVLTKKEELDSVRLSDKVVIVLDVLFATSTIITALAHGALEVIPAEDEHAARREASKLSADSYILAGELYAETIDGFASPTPLALLDAQVRGKRVVYSTTNGTVALKKAQDAPHVYAAALLNGAAVVAHVAKEHPDHTVLIACAGSMDNFNLEDFFGAGYLVERFAQRLEGAGDFTDAALAARAVFDPARALDVLLKSRVGKMMLERNLRHEVEFAARLDEFAIAPRLIDGRLRSASQ